MTTAETRPPLPPFTLETAIQKVRAAEDGWNSRNPERVSLAYSAQTRWRNRSEFVVGREQVVAFLRRKWARELDYRLIKELWAFRDNRIAVRFAYEWHDDAGNWFRSFGNENWEFDEQGLMTVRHASINDLPIREEDRKYHWPLGRRPDDHPGLSSLGF
jgi:uncharacterized protein